MQNAARHYARHKDLCPMEAGHRPLDLAEKGDGEWSFVKKDEHLSLLAVFTNVFLQWLLELL